jgi:hypothetical protein
MSMTVCGIALGSVACGGDRTGSEPAAPSSSEPTSVSVSTENAERIPVDCLAVWNAAVEGGRWTAPEGAQTAQLSVGVSSIDGRGRSVCIYWFFDVEPNLIVTLPLDGNEPLMPLPPDTFFQIRGEDVTTFEPDPDSQRGIASDGTLVGPPVYTVQ